MQMISVIFYFLLFVKFRMKVDNHMLCHYHILLVIVIFPSSYCYNYRYYIELCDICKNESKESIKPSKRTFDKHQRVGSRVSETRCPITVDLCKKIVILKYYNSFFYTIVKDGSDLGLSQICRKYMILVHVCPRHIEHSSMMGLVTEKSHVSTRKLLPRIKNITLWQM